MWVKDYMLTSLTTAKKDLTIKQAVELMVKNKTNSLVVVDDFNHPIGTLSSRTLLKEIVPAYLQDDPIFSNFGAEGTFDKYAEKMKDHKIENIMNKDIHILSINDAMIEAASYSIKSSKRILPVVDESGNMVGVITRTCIKNSLYKALFNDNQINAENSGSHNK